MTEDVDDTDLTLAEVEGLWADGEPASIELPAIRRLYDLYRAAITEFSDASVAASARYERFREAYVVARR